MTQTAQKKAIILNTIDSLIGILKSQKNYKEAIKQGCNNYNINQFKINKIRLEEIPELVNLIELNYINLEKQSENNHDKKKCSWLANQLKLFIWIAICHSYLLNKPLEEYDENDWAFFTHIFTRKTSNDLEFQIKSVFKNFHGNKEKWDEEEEELLKLIIEDDQNKGKWNEVSRLLYFRSNKKYYRSSQKCRQYWFNHLDPSLNKSTWTIDEDLKLVKQLQTYGFKWSKLTQIIENTWGYRRTQHMVKNRTKLLCKKYGFKEDKEQGCMKQLAKIQKKLQEQKLKLSQSITLIKEQYCSDQKESIPIQADISEEEKPKKSKPKQRNGNKQEKKQQKNNENKQEESENQLFEEKQLSQKNLDSLSSEQVFEQEKPRKIPIKAQEPYNKRNVIILFHANNHVEQQKDVLNGEPKMIQEEESSEVMIGQHIEEGLQNQLPEDNLQEEVFQDEYNIVEEVEDNQHMDLNEEMQFEHHTHGGRMRERVTHELAKFFPTAQSPIRQNCIAQNPTPSV